MKIKDLLFAVTISIFGYFFVYSESAPLWSASIVSVLLILGGIFHWWNYFFMAEKREEKKASLKDAIIFTVFGLFILIDKFLV
ncbi:DUF308 domain-containing protein [Risungbinella massiliensis]|uniref:DUF308 domain-containing protein n=1 Tax=Risungbinella massiliensis TaxID=1329796 RepID=UPI0005CBCB94|nr:DUF308 domain-containing protein [Risungbinella massiliensis]